jgi:ATP-dependent Clp protease ATP-binding subunit ClpA
MWQRFTERARRIVFFAQEEAARLGENYVNTEHLLLGLVRENDSVAACILERMGVSLNRIRSEVERQVTRGNGQVQDLQLTPRGKRVVDLAYDESRLLSNNYIGTEHLLLGLIREEEGLAGRVLAQQGVDLERTRQEVRALQDNDSGRPTAGAPTDHARQFAQEYARLPADQQAAIRGKGLPLHKLSEAMQEMVRQIAAASSQGGHFLPDPNGLLHVDVATVEGGTHFTLTTKAAFQIDLVVKDE